MTERPRGWKPDGVHEVPRLRLLGVPELTSGQVLRLTWDPLGWEVSTSAGERVECGDVAFDFCDCDDVGCVRLRKAWGCG